MNLSASSLACGCSGVIQWYTNLSCAANCANSSELKGGPLSESTHCGIPWCPNIRSSLAWVGLNYVE